MNRGLRDMGITTDPKDPRLSHGVDTEPTPQAEAYLVLTEEERAKGFVRPYRESYTHVGAPGPRYPLRDLTDEEKEKYERFNYVKYERYPEDDEVVGMFWTQEKLDKVGQGCGESTRMHQAIAETYARDPFFYGATFCTRCGMHLPVEEFVWDDGSDERVGS